MFGVVRRCAIGLFVCGVCSNSAPSQGWQHIGAVQRVEKLRDGIELTAGRAKVRITAFTDGVIRVRVAPQGTFPKDFSWAVIEAPEPPSTKIEDVKNEVRLIAGNTTAVVQKSPFLINFAHGAGQVFPAE